MNKCKSCGGRGRINAGYGSGGDMYHNCPDCDKQPSDDREFERVIEDRRTLMNDIGGLPVSEDDKNLDDNLAIALVTYFEGCLSDPESDVDDEIGWSCRAMEMTENLELRVISVIANRLLIAHNADRAADKAMIAELEKRPEVLPTMGLMMHVVDVQEQRIERLEECLRMCVPYLPEATATKDEVMEALGGDA